MFEIFGVDMDSEDVVMLDGSRWPVDTWYNPLSQECEKAKAALAIFQGPRSGWFAVDLRTIDKGIHPVH